MKPNLSRNNYIQLCLLILCLFNTLSKAHSALPAFNEIKNITQKKQAFFNYLMPLAQKANELVLKSRQKLLVLKKKKKLNAQDKLWLKELSQRFQLTKQQELNPIYSLLTKVDAVPISLLLAQAANESAWGSSRFARQGNNLFGQWCYQANCGIVPQQRTKGKVHEVKKFKSTFDSIKSYIHNLNTHPSYAELRKIRATLRRSNKNVSGLVLTQGLMHYSERGVHYVNDIKNMIKANQLEDYKPKLSLANTLSAR
jgi:Bax protein